MKTLIISKQDVYELLPLKELISELREAYVTYSFNKTVKSQKINSQISETSIVVNMP